MDPAWDEERFRVVREFAMAVPEIVHFTVMTPYPGTEIWHTESRRLTTRDYRLFDIQHAVVPTTLPLERFYEELVRTQAVINRKHLGLRTAFGAARVLAGNLARGQTNFARMLWKFNQVYDPRRQLADHARPVRHELPLPSGSTWETGASCTSTPAARPRAPRPAGCRTRPGRSLPGRSFSLVRTNGSRHLPRKMLNIEGNGSTVGRVE